MIKETYLQETHRMIERAFDTQMPALFGGKRYYSMCKEYSKKSAQVRLKAVHSFRHNAIMRKAGSLPGHGHGPRHVPTDDVWIIFVSKRKRRSTR